MGYSTTDGSAGKGLGSFTDTASTEADFDKVIELIARMGNVRVGTTAERTALTGSSVYEGLHFYDTDLDALMKHDGSGWVIVFRDWVTWTPTYTNFSLGNGTISAKYQQLGRRVHFRIELTLGSTSSASGAIGFSTPVAPASSATKHVGQSVFFDTSTANTYPGQTRIAGGSTINIALGSTSLSVVTVSLLSNTVPTTPATGDTLYVEGSFEVS